MMSERNEPFVLRPANEQDAEQLSDCVSFVMQERRYLTRVGEVSAQAVADYHKRVVEGDGVQFVVVHRSDRSEARVVGWCDILRFDIESLSNTGRLGMGLLPDFRGQGLGLQLIQASLKAAFDKRAERIELEVFASNRPAIRLYDRVGFSMEGRRRRAAFIGQQYEDLLMMGLLRDEFRLASRHS